MIAVLAVSGLLFAATTSTQAFAQHKSGSSSTSSNIFQSNRQSSTVVSGGETEHSGNNAALNFNEGNALSFSSR